MAESNGTTIAKLRAARRAQLYALGIERRDADIIVRDELNRMVRQARDAGATLSEIADRLSVTRARVWAMSLTNSSNEVETRRRARIFRELNEPTPDMKRYARRHRFD